MKAQIRMIIASVIVIALALTAVSGITYSWFSDTDEAEITVTVGEVNVGLSEPTFGYYSNDVKQTGGFYNGGTATYTAATDTASAKVEIQQISDKDSLIMTFNIVNESTIKTVYRLSATTSGDLSDYLTSTFEVGGVTAQDVTSWIQADVPTEETKNIEAKLTITLDSNGEANGLDSATTISLKVEAFQANTPGEDLPEYTVTKTLTETGTVSQTFTNGDNNVTSVGVTISDASAGTYTIGSITSSENNSYTVTVDSGSAQTVISGISVSTSTSGVDLSSKPGVLTFVLNSSLISEGKLATGYSIVHKTSDGTVEAVTLGTAAESAAQVCQDKNYYIDTTTSTLTLYVTGFSSYLVVVDADAQLIKADGTVTYYTSVSGAITASEKGDTVRMLRDVVLDADDKMAETFSGTFDGQNYTLTVGTAYTQDNALFKYPVYAKVCNLNYTSEASSMIPLTYGYRQGAVLEFDSVNTLAGEYKATKNGSAYLRFFYGTELTFRNCTNNASFYAYQTNSYNGVFVGGYTCNLVGNTYFEQNINFQNCVNNGDMTMTHPGMFFGNPQYLDGDKVTLTVEGCSNQGTLTGFVYASVLGSGPNYSQSNAGEFTTKYDSEIETVSKGTVCDDSKIVVKSDSTLALKKSGDGLTITAATADVEEYKIAYTHYAECYTSDNVKVGTAMITVYMDAEPGQSYAKYAFMDIGSYKGANHTEPTVWTGTATNGLQYYVDETNHIIVINNPTTSYEINSKVVNYIKVDESSTSTTPYVVAYDSDGKIVAISMMTS